MSLYKITIFFGLVSLLISGNGASKIPETIKKNSEKCPIIKAVKNSGGDADIFHHNDGTNVASFFKNNLAHIGEKKRGFPNYDPNFPSTLDIPDKKFKEQMEDKIEHMKPKNKDDIVRGSEHEIIESKKIVNGAVISDEKKEEDTENKNGKISHRTKQFSS